MKGLKIEKPQLKQLATDASRILKPIDHFSRRWYSNDLNGAAIFNHHHKLHNILGEQLEQFEKVGGARETFESILEASAKEIAIVAPPGSPTGI